MKPSEKIREIYEELQKGLGDKGDTVTAIIQYLDEQWEKKEKLQWYHFGCGIPDTCNCKERFENGER